MNVELPEALFRNVFLLKNLGLPFWLKERDTSVIVAGCLSAMFRAMLAAGVVLLAFVALAQGSGATLFAVPLAPARPRAAPLAAVPAAGALAMPLGGTKE